MGIYLGCQLPTATENILVGVLFIQQAVWWMKRA
jgi:hypothetical protein